MKYFYNKKIKEITLPEQGYKVGNDWNAKNTFVLLTDKQLAFLEANPTASALEVYNYLLKPAPTPPTPEDLFNPDTAIIDIETVFLPKMIELSTAYLMIKPAVYKKNFAFINSYSKGLVISGQISNTELTLLNTLM